MCAALHLSARFAVLLRVLRLVSVLAGCAAMIAAAQLSAQTPAAQPSVPVSESAPAADAQHPQLPLQGDQDPVFSSPPVAIVPLDKSIPGAALSVEGPLQAWKGRAYLTSSGTVTAGDGTAQVTLPYRGTLRVCASSTVKLAADSSAPAGQVPGLRIALDHGAVEMSFASSAARERNADTLLTPYFRILIGGPSATDVKVRLGEDGDTCVDNAGTDAPYVVVTSVFDSGLYRVQPGQRVMFEHGSLHEVVDQEKEPCGCPPAPKSEANEFPLAQSEGLTLAPKPATTAVTQPAGNDKAATTLAYNGGGHTPKTVAIPRHDGVPTVAAGASPPEQTAKAKKKRGFFRGVGRFFKRVFGAD
jgi:hypothetical protein